MSVREEDFLFENLNENESSYYLNLLKNSKDIEQSFMVTIGSRDYAFDFVQLGIRKNEDDTVSYNGIVSNKKESKYVNGKITNLDGNGYSIESSVYRLSSSVDDRERRYKVSETFLFEDECVVRKTSYDCGVYFESKLPLFEQTLNPVEKKLNLK